MDTSELKWTSLQRVIFTFLCVKAGEKLSQRSIAEALSVSPTAVGKSLPLLEKKGLITYRKDKRMNLSYISLNRESRQTMRLKRAENLRVIYEYGLADTLEETFPGCTVILFGSYSRGEDTIDSDIDIAVIGAREKFPDLRNLEGVYNRKININFYPSIPEIHKNLRANLFNGIVLSGTVTL